MQVRPLTSVKWITQGMPDSLDNTVSTPHMLENVESGQVPLRYWNYQWCLFVILHKCSWSSSCMLRRGSNAHGPSSELRPNKI